MLIDVHKYGVRVAVDDVDAAPIRQPDHDTLKLAGEVCDHLGASLRRDVIILHLFPKAPNALWALFTNFTIFLSSIRFSSTKLRNYFPPLLTQMLGYSVSSLMKRRS